MRLIAPLSVLLAFGSQPAAAAQTSVLQTSVLAPLERQIAALVASRPGEFGIAALDLSTGNSISFNGNQPFPMASTVKVAIAATYLSHVDRGTRSLNDMIGKQSAQKLIELMLIHSDNIATDRLLMNLGGPSAVNQWLRSHELSGIRIDRTIAQLLGDRRDLRDTRDSSTPLAMIQLLSKLDTGGVLKPESKSFLLATMSRCVTGPNRMRGLLPAEAQVAHKTGTLNGLTDDVGIITFPNGRKIAVALFARGGVNRARTIAEAARTIYYGFGAEMGGSFMTAMGTR